MSESVVTIWRCDRCDRRIEMPDREQPAQWERIDHRKPPRSAESTEFGTVCRECSDAFRDWWTAGSVAPERHDG